MTTLIIGEIKGFGETLSNYLDKKKHVLTVVDLSDSMYDVYNVKGKMYYKNRHLNKIEGIFASWDFDNVIFIPPMTDYYTLPHNSTDSDRSWVTYFARAIEKSALNKVKKFIFCSSLFCKHDNVRTFEGVHHLWNLQAAEEYCDTYAKSYDNLSVITLRLPYIFCKHNLGNFEDMILKGIKEKKLSMFANEDGNMEFICDVDLSKVVHRSVIVVGSGRYDVRGERINVNALIAKISTGGAMEKSIVSKQIPVMPASDNTFMVSEINYVLETTIDEGLEVIYTNTYKKRKVMQKRRIFETYIEPFLPYLEILIGFIIVLVLPLLLVDRYARFAFVDYRLLYVVIIASVWGMKHGVIAAVFASIAYYIGVVSSGTTSLIQFLISTDMFLPISLYIIVGVLIGYSFDRIRRRSESADFRRDAVEEKYQFLVSSFKATIETKEALAQQVANYSDSFGRIYSITKSLDFLQPERVTLAAINILEDSFDTETVAIYFLNKNNLSYARLIACSETQSSKLASSLKMGTLPEVQATMFANDIYINKSMKPGMPAYATYIYQGNHPIALVLIQNVGFDKYSYYYSNLFRIITGLIQTSLEKAYQFYDPQNSMKYIPNTNILTYTALLEKFEAKQRLRSKTKAEFTIIKIENDNIPASRAGSIIKPLIRESDDFGLGNNGKYYVILSYTSEEEARYVIDRMTKKDLDVTMVDTI